VREAKRHLRRWSRINLVVANGESIPVPDESQDAVTSIFMFHELPNVRRIVFREFAPLRGLLLLRRVQSRADSH
jgi:ubiquinone/menaquinone biosynthesis C-methylase UbiE